MVFSSSFKSYVMEEERYYKFHKEIDYYTGLTRSDEDLLAEILKRFEERFKTTDHIYDSIDFDAYFTEIVKGSEGKHDPVAKHVDEKEIKSKRPTKEALEAYYNRRIEQIPDPGTILKKEGSISLEQLLIILGNVLRNSEGVENKALKIRAYKMQIKYSLVWTILYREYLIDYVIKNEKLPGRLPRDTNFESYLKNIPISVQRGMNKHLGTPKLSPIILLKLKEDLKSKTVSDLETFMSVTLYSDIQGTEFPKYLKELSKKLKKNVVRDYLFYKVLEYYYRRTRPGSPNEELYLELLSDLRIRTHRLGQRMKLRLIEGIKDAKQAFDETQ